MWGVVIVVFSAVSFVGMGGYFVGAAFGILGGALALTYKPLHNLLNQEVAFIFGAYLDPNIQPLQKTYRGVGSSSPFGSY